MARFKRCRAQGCSTLIPYDQANPYCMQHAEMYRSNNVSHRVPKSQSLYNKYKRNKQANAFYQSKVWEHLAAETKRRAYFTCACCGHTYDKPGYLVTDHIVPLRIDGRKRLDTENLWVLCKACHYWKGKLEDKLYQSDSMIENLDTAKQWSRERIINWILARKK